MGNCRAERHFVIAKCRELDLTIVLKLHHLSSALKAFPRLVVICSLGFVLGSWKMFVGKQWHVLMLVAQKICTGSWYCTQYPRGAHGFSRNWSVSCLAIFLHSFLQGQVRSSSCLPIAIGMQHFLKDAEEIFTFLLLPNVAECLNIEMAFAVWPEVVPL